MPPSSLPPPIRHDWPLPKPPAVVSVSDRIGEIHRVTGETDVRVALNLDGSGRCQVATGVPFLDHMLHQLASHGLLDLEITASGDTHIDDHHSNEDVGIAVGQALAQALGDRHCAAPRSSGYRHARSSRVCAARGCG